MTQLQALFKLNILNILNEDLRHSFPVIFAIMFTRIHVVADSSEPVHTALFVHRSRCSDADVQSRKIRVIYFIRCVHTREPVSITARIHE